MKNTNSAISSAIVVLLIVLTACVAAAGGYYLSGSSFGRSLFQTNTTELTANSLTTKPMTSISTKITQGQSITGGSNAALNMTYSSSCVSVNNSGWPSCSGSAYSVVFKNTGNSIVSGGSVQIYFGNGTAIYGETSCNFNSTILPQYTFACNGSTPREVPAYSNVILSILYPNGKTYSYTCLSQSPAIQIMSAALYSGITGDNNSVVATARLVIVLEHMGAPVPIDSIALTSSGIYVSVTSWSITASKSANNSFFAGGNNEFTIDGIITLTLYPITSTPLTINKGESYAYSMNTMFGIEGTLIAQ